MRSRAHIFGLDAISRNLFNARPGSSKGDFFGGSIGHRRSKTSSSRSSTITQTTTTADSSLTKFSSRSNSIATAATSVYTMDDESFAGSGGKTSSRSRSRTRKLLKRSKSPGGSGSEPEQASPVRMDSQSNPVSRSPSRERELEYSDMEDDDRTVLERMRDADESDMDLSMRLELARRNSQNQHGRQVAPVTLEKPVEETIYEGKYCLLCSGLILSRTHRRTSTPHPPSVEGIERYSELSFNHPHAKAYDSISINRITIALNPSPLYFATLFRTPSTWPTPSFSIAS